MDCIFAAAVTALPTAVLAALSWSQSGTLSVAAVALALLQALGFVFFALSDRYFDAVIMLQATSIMVLLRLLFPGTAPSVTATLTQHDFLRNAAMSLLVTVAAAVVILFAREQRGKMKSFKDVLNNVQSFVWPSVRANLSDHRAWFIAVLLLTAALVLSAPVLSVDLMAAVVAVAALLCTVALSPLSKAPLDRFCGRVTEVMREDERCFDDGYGELKKNVEQFKKRERSTPCMLDVPLDHNLSHYFFQRVSLMNKLASFPLGDFRTGDSSLRSEDATKAQRFLETFLVQNTTAFKLQELMVPNPLQKLVKDHVDQERVCTFDPAAVGRLAKKIDTYPALKYLKIAAVLQNPAVIQDTRIRAHYDKIRNVEGVEAHLEALVHYGRSVAKWLLTEVPSSLGSVGPGFAHRLTADLELSTGLGCAYTDAFEAEVDKLVKQLVARSKDVAKEATPIVAVLSNPRSGKSLLLQLLAKRFTYESKQPAVCITYTSHMQMKEEDTKSYETACRNFYARLFVEIAFRHGIDKAQSKQLRQMVVEFDMDYAKFTAALETLGLPMPKLVCIDEFSKIVDALGAKGNESELATFLSSVTELCQGGAKLVFSGFTTHDGVNVQNASGRPVEALYLQPVLMPGAKVLEGFRLRFGPLRAALMRLLSCEKVDFNDVTTPAFVVEPTEPKHLLGPLLPYVLQSCPGLLGHILENGTAPPLLGLLRKLAHEDVARPRRKILLAELNCKKTSGMTYEREQKHGLALPVAGGCVVVHPFGFFVTACQTAFKKHEDPFERHLAELVRRLSSLAQEIHVKSEELFAAPENTVEWAKADCEVEAAELDFMGAAVYYARAMPALGGDTAASSLDLDPECTLHLPAPLFGADDDGMAPRAGVQTHRVSVEEALVRAEAVGAHLGGLERCGVRRFVWRLVRAFNAVADVVEGELTAEGWALRFTAAQLGGAAEVAEQKLQLLAESLTVVPWPFGRETEVASVELVLLCPAGGAHLGAGRLAQDTGLPKAHGRGVAVQVKATAAEVRAYVTTAIAAVLPTGGQR